MIDWRLAAIDAIILLVLGALVALAAIALTAGGEEPVPETIPPPVYVVEDPCETC